MRKISLIGLFLFLFINLCFAFTTKDITVDKKIPYRIYIGSEEFDFIDVVGKYDSIKDDYIFEDRSPIKEIWIDNFNRVFIIKGKSKWLLYWSSIPLKSILTLEYPYIPEKIKEPIMKRIY